jgi:hypothetical protein
MSDKNDSLSLETIQGGPFDGSLSLVLRLVEREKDIASSVLKVLDSPGFIIYPTHFRFISVVSPQKNEGIAHIIQFLSEKAIFTSVEIWDTWEPWMKFINWRIIHELSPFTPFPAEEIIFHTEEYPTFVPFPVQVTKPPVLAWAVNSMDKVYKAVENRSFSPSMRIYLPSKEKKGKLLWERKT